MRVFLTVIYLLASLAGCDIAPNNSITARIETNGVTLLNSVTTRTAQGADKFSCLASDSGKCFYLVYADRCTDGAPAAKEAHIDPAKPRPGCTPKTLRSFTVAQGKAVVIDGLERDFRQCVARDAAPVAPACTMP